LLHFEKVTKQTKSPSSQPYLLNRQFEFTTSSPVFLLSSRFSKQKLKGKSPQADRKNSVEFAAFALEKSTQNGGVVRNF